MNKFPLHSEYISGMRIDESYGKYRISCKVGTYCSFGYDQISNQRHNHDCYELCIIISGTGNYYYEEKAYKLNEGDIIIANPNSKHEIIASQKENLVLLYIFITISENPRYQKSGSYADECIEGFLKAHYFASSQKHLLAYIGFIEQYNQPNKKYLHGTAKAIENLILECLALLSKNTKSENEEIVKNTIENALDYIDQNLHTRIFVRDIALSSCTTTRNLEYLFKKQLGKTIVSYVNEKKTELACHYLSMYFNVSDTAEMVGIKNVSQFSLMFKKYMKMSPLEYQKKITDGGKGMGRRI